MTDDALTVLKQLRWAIEAHDFRADPSDRSNRFCHVCDNYITHDVHNRVGETAAKRLKNAIDIADRLIANAEITS
jgi:hypothetical protein